MQKYGETRMGLGMSSAGVLVELWHNVETGTWTTVLTNAQGISCIVAEGDEWAVSEPEPEGDPA